jgi:methyltransferase family protein
MMEDFPTLWRENTTAMRSNWPRRRVPNLEPMFNQISPIPSPKNIKRISGHDDSRSEIFLRGGYDHLNSIFNLMDVCSNIVLTDASRVLDWGVGCGRISRHMPNHLRKNLIGIDVDPINVEWCQAKMEFGQYFLIDPFHQTAFPECYFDLIYSHSVLTHLNENDMFFWIQELARICRGVMVLSVHGMYSSATYDWTKNPQLLDNWLRSGFQPGYHQNTDIADVTPTGYYTDVSMTARYIYEKWSEHVEVLDVICGGFGGLHDAVICRKKA